jgi:SAM-dependent methyltransferase
VILDLGCGDGRSVIVAAAAEPRSLVVGIDSAPAAMAEASRRAARAQRKGGLPNALFVVSAVEAVDPVLQGVASRVCVLFPWGSLLRGALGVDRDVASSIAALVRPGGRLVVTMSVAPRDGIAEVPCLDEVAVAAVVARLACHGLRLVAARRLSGAEVAALPSTWARRLAASRSPAEERPVWTLELELELERSAVRASRGATRQRG